MAKGNRFAMRLQTTLRGGGTVFTLPHPFLPASLGFLSASPRHYRKSEKTKEEEWVNLLCREKGVQLCGFDTESRALFVESFVARAQFECGSEGQCSLENRTRLYVFGMLLFFLSFFLSFFVLSPFLSYLLTVFFLSFSHFACLSDCHSLSLCLSFYVYF